jgi:hypothetical protein
LARLSTTRPRPPRRPAPRVARPRLGMTALRRPLSLCARSARNTRRQRVSLSMQRISAGQAEADAASVLLSRRPRTARTVTEGSSCIGTRGSCDGRWRLPQSSGSSRHAASARTRAPTSLDVSELAIELAITRVIDVSAEWCNGRDRHRPRVDRPVDMNVGAERSGSVARRSAGHAPGAAARRTTPIA